MNERGGIGRTIGIAIAVIFIAGFVFVGYRLYAQGERIRLTPVVFVVVLMVFVFVSALRKPGKANKAARAAPFHAGSAPQKISTKAEDEGLHLLLKSRDCVFITTLASELKKEGIEFTVLDQYAGRMMRFVPDMEMKVMVSAKDYDRCYSIANDLVDVSTSEDTS